MYNEEELLEAVDILVEDYGIDEDYAIDLVMESYEEELYNISEAIEILVEDYGIDEDYAIEMIMESYEDLLLEADKPQIITPEGRMVDATAKNGMLVGYDTTMKVAGRALGAGALVYGAYRGGHRIAKAGRNLKLKRELKHIAKTGKRTSKRQRMLKEGQTIDTAKLVASSLKPYAPYMGGMIAGAYAANKVADYAIKGTTDKIGRDAKKLRKERIRDLNDAERQKRKAVRDYRRNKIRRKFRRD